MPGMTAENNVPWWAPGRPLIVSDPNKLTYFAQANAVRAGVQSMPGALQGVAVGDSEWASYPDGGPGDMRANTSLDMFNSTATGSNSVGADNVETPSGGGTLDSFFSAINSFLRAPAPNQYGPPPQLAAPSPWPWLVGAGAVGIGLIVLSKRRSR